MGASAGGSVNGSAPQPGHRDAGFQVLYSLGEQVNFNRNATSFVNVPAGQARGVQAAVPVGGNLNGAVFTGTQAGNIAGTTQFRNNTNLTVGNVSNPGAARGTNTAAGNNVTVVFGEASGPALLTGRHYHYAVFGVNQSGRGGIGLNTGAGVTNRMANWTRPADPSCSISDITTRSMVVGSTLAATLDETYDFAQNANVDGVTWPRHNIRHSAGPTTEPIITARGNNANWHGQSANGNAAGGIAGPVGTTGQRFNLLGSGTVTANTHDRVHDFEIQAVGSGGFSNVIACSSNPAGVDGIPEAARRTDTLAIRTVTHRVNTRTAEVDIEFFNGWAIGNLAGWNGTGWTNELRMTPEGATGAYTRQTLSTHNPAMSTLSTQAANRTGTRTRNAWHQVTLRYDELGSPLRNGDGANHTLRVTNTDGFNTVVVERAGVNTQALTFSARSDNGCTPTGEAPRAVTRSTAITGTVTTPAPSLAHGAQGYASDIRWVDARIDEAYITGHGNNGPFTHGPGTSARARQSVLTFECFGNIRRPVNEGVVHNRSSQVRLTDGWNTRTMTSLVNEVQLPAIGATHNAWNASVGTYAVTRSGCIAANPTQAHITVDQARFGDSNWVANIVPNPNGGHSSVPNTGNGAWGGCLTNLVNTHTNSATAMRHHSTIRLNDGLNTREFTSHQDTPAIESGPTRSWNTIVGNYAITRSGCIVGGASPQMLGSNLGVRLNGVRFNTDPWIGVSPNPNGGTVLVKPNEPRGLYLIRWFWAFCWVVDGYSLG